MRIAASFVFFDWRTASSPAPQMESFGWCLCTAKVRLGGAMEGDREDAEIGEADEMNYPLVI